MATKKWPLALRTGNQPPPCGVYTTSMNPGRLPFHLLVAALSWFASSRGLQASQPHFPTPGLLFLAQATSRQAAPGETNDASPDRRADAPLETADPPQPRVTEDAHQENDAAEEAAADTAEPAEHLPEEVRPGAAPANGIPATQNQQAVRPRAEASREQGTAPTTRNGGRRDRGESAAPESSARRDGRSRPSAPASRSFSRPTESSRNSTNVETGGFARFRIITERNVFDASRSSRERRERNENRRPAPAETFTLVGILRDGEKAYAFFDGSTSQFRKVLERGQEIAGHTVADITADRVRLEINSESLELRVGTQMRRREDRWELVRSSAAEASSGASTAASGSDGEEDDVVKRLMRQREEEMK